MRARHLLLMLPLVLVLTGCGDDKKESLGSSPSPSPSATATASGTPCTPTGTGTKDLSKTPVVAKPTAPAPTETTTYDIVCGTGKEAGDGDGVKVKYVGLLYADGSEFDSSWSRGDTFDLTVGSGVIPGFSKGIEGMREGGRREVVIPAKDGYGDSGTGPIPPGETLIFLIDLVKVG